MDSLQLLPGGSSRLPGLLAPAWRPPWLPLSLDSGARGLSLEAIHTSASTHVMHMVTLAALSPAPCPQLLGVSEAARPAAAEQTPYPLTRRVSRANPDLPSPTSRLGRP